MASSPGFQHFDRFAWHRSLQTTMPKIIKEVEDASRKNFQILALLEAAGRITTNHGGEGIQWPVKYRHHKAEGATGENTRNFTPQNLWKQGRMDYRGYEVTDSIKRREMLKNKGEPAIIKVVDGFAQRLRDSLIHELGPQFYINGDLPENERFWHGFLSLAKSNGNTIKSDAPYDGLRPADPADKIIAPEGKYADLQMDLGFYGGEQDSDAPWPESIQDSEYDFWSSLQVNLDSTSWEGTKDGEKLEKALRYGMTHAQRNSTQEEQVTNVWLDRSLFIDLKNFNDDRQTIEVAMGPTLVSLGFRNVMIFDGVEVSWEAAVPPGYGFGINLMCLELLALHEDLFTDEGGPEYDLATQSLNCVVSTLSNLKYKSPRNFCIWKPFTELDAELTFTFQFARREGFQFDERLHS